MAVRTYPALYQVNTRIWLTDLSRQLGRPATLDDIPDAELDRLAALGFDWIWFLSVWHTGPASQRVSRTHPALRREFEATLTDLQEDDIAGSGFAIAGYTVPPTLGGAGALARLRERLHRRSLRLMLDFVPNHTALDHPWTVEHPEYYVSGTELDLARTPANYVRLKPAGKHLLLAHGRDPLFAGWTDTLQLDYGNAATRKVMIGELRAIAAQCDGVRCDMAMLVLPDVFERTWGIPAAPFWPEAIARVRDKVPGFCFMAEVYWDLEWTLQQQGFDYTYDKRLYDRLEEGHAGPVRDHFRAELTYQVQLARFLENHDEPRAATVFPDPVHEAAAVLTFLAPGLRFFHQGQLEGRTRRISPHLIRAPAEPTNERLSGFYQRLLSMLRRPVVRSGCWQLLDAAPAWDGNRTWENFISFAWQGEEGDRLLVVVNYGSVQSQCYMRLPFPDLGGHLWRLADLLGPYTYDRDGGDLAGRGLYLDLAPWQYHVFALTGLEQPES